MKLAKKLLFLGIVIFSFLFITTSIESRSYADAGNFRGKTNYSRGGSSSGKSSNFGSSRSSGSGFFGFPFFGFGGSTTFIIILILYFIIKYKGKGRTGYDDNDVGLQASRFEQDDSIEMLYEMDPNFQEDYICEKVGRIYVDIQNHWQNADWEPMRAYLTPQLYSRLENQLRDMIANGHKNYVNNIAVLNVEVLRFYKHEDNQELEVLIETRAIDYTVDRDNNIVNGNPNEEVFMGYIYHMIRNVNTTTPEGKDVKTMKCPCCGAPIDLNRSARCEYCGTIIEAKDYDWVLSAIEGIYQSSTPVDLD